MKKIFLAILSLVITGSLINAQKTINDANAEKRNVSGFHGIEVATGISLVLTKGNTEDVAVSASKTEYRDKIVTRVEKGVLKIYYENKIGSINFNNHSQGKELNAYVSYKSLDQLTATTGAEVEIDGTIDAQSFDLTANTGAEVNGKINAAKLKVNQDTGSKITLSGTASQFEADGDTGSKFMGEDLNTMTCDISVNTGAKVWISAEKELKVKANTGGMVKYKGSASVTEMKTHTGGSVTKI